MGVARIPDNEKGVNMNKLLLLVLALFGIETANAEKVVNFSGTFRLKDHDRYALMVIKHESPGTPVEKISIALTEGKTPNDPNLRKSTFGSIAKEMVENDEYGNYRVFIAATRVNDVLKVVKVSDRDDEQNNELHRSYKVDTYSVNSNGNLLKKSTRASSEHSDEEHDCGRFCFHGHAARGYMLEMWSRLK